jgi:membrane protease YdiL (CAAX protease family)
MTLGWALHLDPNRYLLIGVPLVAAFQLFIHKKPLVALWVREAPPFRLGPLGIILALAFAALPAIDLLHSFKSPSWSAHIPELLWSICCLGGAVGAAFALSQSTRATWKSLGFCMATAGVIGCGIMIGTALLQKHSLFLTAPKLWGGLRDFLLYFPICFILEEVAFRGAIDSHIHQSGDRHSRLSALFVSASWGLWHLPMLGESRILYLIGLAVLLPLLHLFDGMFLSYGWRRSGNLAVPAAVHALIDAVRNAVLR